MQAPRPQSSSLSTTDTYAIDATEPVETPLPTGYLVSLISVIPTEALSSLSQLLTRLLPLELEDIPRGTISSALKKSQACTSLEKGVQGLENTLQGICLVYQEKDNAYGIVAGN